MKRFLVPAFILLVGLSAVSAQVTNCSQTLRLANSTYEQGRLHELEALLENCLKSGFTETEKVQAYRLLTLAYIYLEEPEKADASMLKILQTDHYFEINPAVDPAEFVALYNTFRTSPVFRLGLKAGANVTQPNVASYDAASDGSRKYGYKFGFQVGGAFELPITDRLVLSPELNFALKSFSFKQNGIAGTSSAGYSISADENQLWMSLPITVQYYFLKDRTGKNTNTKKLLPYLTGGVSIDYLLNAKKSPSKIRGANLSDVKEEAIDITPQRAKLNISIVGGAGIKYRITGGFVVADVRYYYGISKLTSKQKTFANQDLIFNYNMSDGIFSQNSIMISVGYVYNIFNPIKKRATK